MSVIYSHDQFGSLVVALIVPFALFMAVVLASAGLGSVLLSVWLVSFVLLVLFYRLSVEVTREHLRFRFGIGLIGRTFDVAEIVAASAVRNKWYYGWGIRLTPHGWLYNVSGFDAVEVQMRSGKKYRIGTDEPEALAGALNRAIGTRQTVY
jgi:hypothetical protein